MPTVMHDHPFDPHHLWSLAPLAVQGLEDARDADVAARREGKDSFHGYNAWDDLQVALKEAGV